MKELRFTTNCGGGDYQQRCDVVNLDLGFLTERMEKTKEKLDWYGHGINDGDLYSAATTSKGCSAMANSVCNQRMGLREKTCWGFRALNRCY